MHTAQDLTQEFFETVLERNAIGAADPDRGRFRSFLLTACKNFLTDEWDKSRAQKRGGRRLLLSLNLESAESRYALCPVDKLSPERVYEKQWALTFLEHVLHRLGDEMQAKGKDRQFRVLMPLLTGEAESGSYEAAARELGTSEAATKVAVHRLRRRYREILRTEIAQTVADPDEVDDEIHRLRAMLE